MVLLGVSGLQGCGFAAVVLICCAHRRWCGAPRRSRGPCLLRIGVFSRSGGLSVGCATLRWCLAVRAVASRTIKNGRIGTIWKGHMRYACLTEETTSTFAYRNSITYHWAWLLSMKLVRMVSFLLSTSRFINRAIRERLTSFFRYTRVRMRLYTK